MTFTEIIDTLRNDLSVEHRFPARVIFADNLDAYLALEKHLREFCDITINLADERYCPKPDHTLNLELLQEDLAEYSRQGEPKMSRKAVLLLSIGEYLRIFQAHRDVHYVRDLWNAQQSAISKTRYIIPMFRCREIFDRVIDALDISRGHQGRQEGWILTLDNNDPECRNYDLELYSPNFRDSFKPDTQKMKVYEGVREWLGNWQANFESSRKSGRPCKMLTRFCKYADRSVGVANMVRVHVFESPFDCVKQRLTDGDSKTLSELSGDVRDEKFWGEILTLTRELFDQSDQRNAIDFKELVKKVLNVQEIDCVHSVSLWTGKSETQHRLLWMYCRLYPDTSYFSHACQRANTWSEVPARMRDTIFEKPGLENWIKERADAATIFSELPFNDEYMAKLKELPGKTRLKLFTYQCSNDGKQEKEFAIRTISEMLRDGADMCELAEIVYKNGYDALAVYMSTSLAEKIPDDSKVSALNEYMSWYRKHKLMNKYPGEFAAKINPESFSARSEILANKMPSWDSCEFWIDGLGIEWAPLLLHELRECISEPAIEIESVNVGYVNLPTETEFNKQWTMSDEKRTRLDDLNHNGITDEGYFSCIVDQFAVLKKIAGEIKGLLANCDYVAITGDHGSSRLAALAFHDKSVEKIFVPEGAVAKNYGRFCEFTDASVNEENFVAMPNTRKCEFDGRVFVVMDNHQHFISKGNPAGGNSEENDVAGEVHGGNTPEERLVPVIVIRRKKFLPPVTCVPEIETVKRSNVPVDIVLNFSRSIRTLEVKLNDKILTCWSIPEPNTSSAAWKVKLDKISGREFRLSVVINGSHKLDDIILKVKSGGMSKNEDPFDF